jgi:hypothetical protein
MPIAPDWLTYKVVAFIVNVKLVEKSVKRNVGNCQALKVMIRYIMPGRNPIRATIRRPIELIKDPWLCCSACVVATATAVLTALRMLEVMVLARTSGIAELSAMLYSST